MIKKITWLLSLSLFSLMVLVHQEAGAEDMGVNPENIAVKKEMATTGATIGLVGMTSVVIVRHAEKMNDSANSPLTVAGECRAESLARMLIDSGISVVFSTKFSANDPDPQLRGQPIKRTQETVNNYADLKSIAIQYYDSTQNLATLIKSQYSGKSILVAAHSGTVEQLITNLGAGSIPPIGNEFNNLFLVTIPPIGKLSKPSLMRMKYGC